MADNKPKNEKSLEEQLKEIFTLDNLQKYVLGTRKNGEPRALYDIYKDQKKCKKKKGKYSFYKMNKKKKKKKKDKKKDWYISDFYID